MVMMGVVRTRRVPGHGRSPGTRAMIKRVGRRLADRRVCQGVLTQAVIPVPAPRVDRMRGIGIPRVRRVAAPAFVAAVRGVVRVSVVVAGHVRVRLRGWGRRRRPQTSVARKPGLVRTIGTWRFYRTVISRCHLRGSYRARRPGGAAGRARQSTLKGVLPREAIQRHRFAFVQIFTAQAVIPGQDCLLDIVAL